MQRAECITISPSRSEIDDRAIGEFDAEIRLSVDLRFSILGQRDTVHQVRVVVELEFDLLDKCIEMPLVRCRDQPLAPASYKRKVQRIGGNRYRLSTISSVQMNDIVFRCPKIIDLMRPVEAFFAIPVAQICLTPLHRVEKCFRKHLFVSGNHRDPIR
jgi:hypothetical protein